MPKPHQERFPPLGIRFDSIRFGSRSTSLLRDWTKVRERRLELNRALGDSWCVRELVEHALDDYAAGKADFADYLILGIARAAAGELLTIP